MMPTAISLQKPTPAEFGHTHGDHENRLKQASKTSGVTVSYAYDALGRRVQRTSTTEGTTKFVYDGADVMRDLDDNGVTVADYLNAPGIDNKLRQSASGTVSYFVTDHLGTTRAFTDASGTLTSSLTYDSFGNVVSGSAPRRYTYTGREADSETGLMYYRARWYDPQQGRFISEDPIEVFGGLNFYSYTNNNPLTHSDPLGLLPDNPYDIIPESGWIVIAHVGNFAAGFRDTITSLPFTNWSLTRQVRLWMGTDDVVDRCSGTYSAGGWAGVAWEIAMGSALGGRSMVKQAGTEWSHWIPKRYGRVPDFVRSSRFNGNFRSVADHALNDPFRHRLMPRGWKDVNSINPAFRRQINRAPDWLKGGAIAGGWAALNKSSQECDCK